MDNLNGNLVAVLLGILLYLLFVLLPLVPAVIIYRIFPETKVAVKGPLGQLGLNTSGAFAAYVTVCVLGFFLVQFTQGLISGLTRQTSIVTSQVTFVDSAGNPLDDAEAEELAKLLQVRVLPPYDVTSRKVVRLIVPEGHLEGALIQYTLAGFTSAEVSVAEHILDSRQRIDLGKVSLKRVVQPYQPQGFPGLQEIAGSPAPGEGTRLVQAANEGGPR